MTWTQFAAVQDRSAPIIVERNYQHTPNAMVELRLDCTPFSGLAHPFNDPGLSISVQADISYDSGTTYRLYFGPSAAVGSTNGVWGKTNAFPLFGTTLPKPPLMAEPDRYRVTITPSATITFGASVQES